ncbi:MAG: YcgJ family protein [Candidatus Competibacteraceae bacterium]
MMKLTKTIMILGVLVLAGQMPLMSAQAKGPRAQCDDQTQICDSQNGPKQHKGGGKHQGGGNQGGGQHQGGGGKQDNSGRSGGNTFSPTTGVHCDRAAQAYYDSTGPNPVYTRMFFGESAVNRFNQ